MKEDYTNHLLLATPILDDPNFNRTVIWVLEHTESGAAGFVLNRPISQRMGEIIHDFPMGEFPVFWGGPVENNTLHFVHQYGNQIEGGQSVSELFSWGGSFEQIIEKAEARNLHSSEIRFFVGYSGWSEGQLEGEFKEKVWVKGPEFYPKVLEMDPKSMWRIILRSMGGDYAIMANNPENPSLN